MEILTKFQLILMVATITYSTISKQIFDRVHETTPTVIDELFHIPQGMAYCQRNFSYWDPKITTLPGLYLVSAALLGSFFECNTYNLRFINLVGSVVNLLIFGSILKFIYGGQGFTPLKIVMQAVNLAILPPLYFFSHVYYTDTLSLTFLLAFSRLCFTNKRKLLMLILGLCSVLMRQTNIVWLAMVLGYKGLDMVIRSSRVYGNQYLTRVKLSKTSVIACELDPSKLKRYYTLTDAFIAIKYHCGTGLRDFFYFLSIENWVILIMHSLTLICFGIFVLVNGSIVLGDKEAHQASLHLPQMLYFLLFYGIFGLPYVLSRFVPTIHMIFVNKLNVFLLAVIFSIVVHYNTVVHPYLLADNRHFTFYIWNRWFGRYDYAIYATIPIYIFLLFNLYINLKDQNCVTFLLPYTVCLFLAVALQKMIEVRYFLIPYLILRLRFARPSNLVANGEFIWYLILNFAAYYVFFNKKIMWSDFDYAQRIIW